MKKALLYLLLLPMLLALAGCVDEESYADTPQGNFEALWNIIDQRYCFLDYKAQEYGLDWNEVHRRYSRMMNAGMTESQVFEVLCNMLSELRDGHVNLYSSFDVARNWSWHEDYPSNFSDTLFSKYIGTDYRIASGMKYRVLDDNTGYLRCETFTNDIGSGNLDDILLYLAPCNGLIIDLRNNTGGMISSAEKLAARFTNEETLVGYMQHKTGPGHGDFSAMKEQILKPAKGARWQKRVVVLTNRSVYSAANEFVKYMKCCPGVTVVGDKTGGGAGLPFSSELPNGWSVRFSACPMYDRQQQSTEFGIDPDYKVDLTQEDFRRGRDTLIEYARKLLRE
ncbi:S41 family peptidase [Prevotella sp. KH2C16]|uniref:S41 family peptidase n=1 Tax=Prevotella sp. KH2C16 TaxID=1855325 RepID=UPI0008EC7DAF|nr:S41 family peptidase [Prevotella sp. KH2C16]SFG50112.1 Tricorn protease C1 domain-containing protein [Prevotella sp. KH2C16]